MKFLKLKVFALFFILPLIGVNAKDIYANSMSFYDVSLAVNTATPGDTVILPIGTGNWGDHTLAIKGGIKLIGQGSSKTIITRTISTTNHLIYFECENGLPIELHNIGFKGTLYNDSKASRGVLLREGCVNFRISGCTFTEYAGCGLCITDAKTPESTQKGVIYNNKFINNYHPDYTSGGYGVVVSGNGTWTDLELGTENAIFVEDNFFSGNKHHIASNNGSRYVFRYNEVEHTDLVKNFAMVDAHGYNGNDEIATVGSRSFEIYNNNFKIKSDNPDNNRIVAAVGIRGGDGVIFNNKVSESIVRTVKLYLEQQDLCGQEIIPYQSNSIYIWDNEHNDDLYANWGLFTIGHPDNHSGATLENGVSSDCSLSSLKKDSHYFLYASEDYHSFDYPHPLRSNCTCLLYTSDAADE